MMIKDYWYRVTERLGEAWLDFQAAHSRRFLLGVLAAGLLLVGIVVALVIFVERTPVGDPGDVATSSELMSLADALERDPELSSFTLPADVVRKGNTVDTDAPNGEVAFEGTIGKRSPSGACYGFSVRLDAEYVLRGNLEGVSVGEVALQEEDVCTTPGEV